MFAITVNLQHTKLSTHLNLISELFHLKAYSSVKFCFIKQVSVVNYGKRLFTSNMFYFKVFVVYSTDENKLIIECPKLFRMENAQWSYTVHSAETDLEWQNPFMPLSRHENVCLCLSIVIWQLHCLLSFHLVGFPLHSSAYCIAKHSYWLNCVQQSVWRVSLFCPLLLVI